LGDVFDAPRCDLTAYSKKDHIALAAALSDAEIIASFVLGHALLTSHKTPSPPEKRERVLWSPHFDQVMSNKEMAVHRFYIYRSGKTKDCALTRGKTTHVSLPMVGSFGCKPPVTRARTEGTVLIGRKRSARSPPRATTWLASPGSFCHALRAELE
jgi:hypothetical protein